jgi:UDP-N-acetylmuramate--alanine ligase
MASPARTVRPGEPGRVVPNLLLTTASTADSNAPRAHVIAAGGAAMSAICRILVALGWNVTGSDQASSETVDRLRADGISVTIGHDPVAVSGADLVVVSTAIKGDNPELVEAIRLGLPVAGRPEVMEALGQLRRVVAVSGTHGKTTTSAMAALCAQQLGWNPSFIVGGVINGLSTGVQWTSSDLLVVEADESDNSFLRFIADHAIVTNIEADHLDFHGSMANLEAAFDRFVTQGSGPSVVCLDDEGNRSLLARVETDFSVDQREAIHTYGFHPNAEYRIVDARSKGLKTWCSIHHNGSHLADLALSVPGLHNISNALSVFALYHQMGADPQLLVSGLASFTGVGRRFEFRGTAADVTFVDDYAHLPTEVSTVLRAARAGGWKRVVGIFQPHRYTRIRDVGADFADSFVDADVVVITGLYAAGQAPIAGVGASTVADAVRRAHPDANLHVIESRTELVEFLAATLRPGDLCLTMNAGDLTSLPDDMLARLGKS